MSRFCCVVVSAFALLVFVHAGEAAVFFSGSGLSGGARWDAAPRVIGGRERSLDGGLRYSVSGGSYEAFRDMFSWNVTPSVAEFQEAVEAAFGAWTAVDPATGLGTDLSFVADFSVAVAGRSGGGGANIAGAEIDLIAARDGRFWNPGSTGLQGESWFGSISSNVTLTSGTVNYAGSRAISGADVLLNSNPEAVYSLDVFRRLLTHELGHSLGLGDVEADLNPGLRFIDDNYDNSSSATTLATLTNSWAGLVDVFNPAASPLSLFSVPEADPGTDTVGVNILMESRGLGIASGNPLSELFPLRNDDYGGRQFLYPFVGVEIPEPGVLGMITAIGSVMVRRQRGLREYGS